MSDPAAEFDGPWKEALDLYFRDFVELFFPNIGREIDWTQPVEPLDKELQQLTPDAVVGRGTVDKLVKVWARTGAEAWVLVHVEVQSQQDAAFAERMYTYNHRLHDRYGRMPVSLAVLGDESRNWMPTEFRAGHWGCEVVFTFQAKKVADWREREGELEQSSNPFAAFALAHLKTLATDRNAADRLEWKLRIVKHLYDCGLGQADVFQLFRLVDWMMTLPPVEARQFDTDFDTFEKEREVPFVTPREQRLLDKGEVRGNINGIQLGLKLRFGADGLALMPRVRQLTDPAAVEALLNAIETAPDLDALRAMIPSEPQT